jgi:hypothetical protein
MEDGSQLGSRRKSWRTFRKAWITSTNLMCLGLISISFLQDYELSNFRGATMPSSAGIARAGPLICAAFLLLGTVFEWMDSTWPAFVVNAGFFAVFGIGVVGKVLLTVLTKPSAQYDPEAGLALAIVGIPFSMIALMDCLLYLTTRPVRNK